MTAGACLGIRVRDHIIVSTDGSFVSLVEAGFLKIDAA
jgi:DNA repair protein RadC